MFPIKVARISRNPVSGDTGQLLCSGPSFLSTDLPGSASLGVNKLFTFTSCGSPQLPFLGILAGIREINSRSIDEKEDKRWMDHASDWSWGIGSILDEKVGGS